MEQEKKLNEWTDKLEQQIAVTGDVREEDVELAFRHITRSFSFTGLRGISRLLFNITGYYFLLIVSNLAHSKMVANANAFIKK